ncbi:hypothetical protein [Nitrosopumilus piranensis]|uniref:Uncharacterized protein n=1 Tax=Nitrosopumilus piranensis TaxID=1582439 RepID=A0A0C5C957_9ARCH|nr:hypothetical protein [Nitrosopumilus piranensis]AJM91752.1 hypothetical protein NPIRD3C_0538 [Nitrosopumilus piranensis]
MALKYIKKQKSYVYQQSAGNAKHRMLIYGDAVDVTDTKKNGRTKVKYGVIPAKKGWVRTPDLVSKGFLEIYFLDVIIAGGIGFVTYRSQDFKKLYKGDKSKD